jgi:drug/metabolite transporter (DMT)-like permease
VKLNQKGESAISHTTAILLFAGTALLWSFGGLLVKLVSLNPMAIAGIRSVIAALLLVAFIGKPKFTWSFPQIGGALMYVLNVLLFVSATKITTAANAILLQYTAPVYIAIFGSWILKEKIKPSDIIIIISVMGGMTLFFMDKFSSGQFLGNLLALLNGVIFAFVFIFMKMQKNESTLETILLGNIVLAIVGIPFYFEKVPDIKSIEGLLMLGIFQLGLSFILYSIAIKRITALEAVLISCIEPILNPVWVFLVLGEFPGTWALAGGLIVFVTVTLRSILLNVPGKKLKKGSVSI